MWGNYEAIKRKIGKGKGKYGYAEVLLCVKRHVAGADWSGRNSE